MYPSVLQYWESHSSTYPRLPPAALLNPAACPRGLSGAALVHVLGQITAAEPAALWDLAGLLDTHRCGFVSVCMVGKVLAGAQMGSEREGCAGGTWVGWEEHTGHHDSCRQTGVKQQHLVCGEGHLG